MRLAVDEDLEKLKAVMLSATLPKLELEGNIHISKEDAYEAHQELKAELARQTAMICEFAQRRSTVTILLDEGETWDAERQCIIRESE